jgi:hypothetical protein
MKKVIKIMSLFICLVVSIIFISGCGTSTNSTNTQTSNLTTQQKYEMVGTVTVDMDDILDNYNVKVSGKLKNISGKISTYASIEYNVYDSNDNLLGTSFDNVSNWENNTVWNFQTIGYITSGKPAKVKLIKVTMY